MRGNSSTTTFPRLDGSQVDTITHSLRKQGIADEEISIVLAGTGLNSA